MFYQVAWWVCFFLFKILFRYKIYGKSKLPKEGPYIMASNHLSYLDPICIGLLIRKRLNFLAREDLFRNKIFAWLIKNLGAIPLDREKQDIRALKEGLRVLKKKKILVIFPEGRRSLDGELGKPLEGVGFLAHLAKVKVVPIYLEGTNLALPINAYFIRLKKISCFVGNPVEPDDYSAEKITELTWEEISRLKREFG